MQSAFLGSLTLLLLSGCAGNGESGALQPTGAPPSASGDPSAGAPSSATAGYPEIASDGGMPGHPNSAPDAGAPRPDAAAGQTVDAAADFDGGQAPATEPSSAADAGQPRMGFPRVDVLGKNGPFATNNALGEVEGPDCEIHRPAKLGEGGLLHPIIVWGMGTGGFNTYQEAFQLWASHGFVVTASLLGDGQGDGKSMMACLEYACEHFAPSVVCRAGATGHSQGGAGAIMMGTDGRVVTTAPIQAYTAQGFGGFDEASIMQQKGPMLLLSGTADTIATPELYQAPVFQKTNVPVVWASFVGGDHVVTGIDGAASYRNVALAWFRLQLMGDEDFRSTFYGPSCSLCADSMWQVQRKGIQ